MIIKSRKLVLREEYDTDDKIQMSVYITNLGKYNEGYLKGEWVEFPISKEDFQKVLDRIGINKYYEEWFVTDYDCPVETGLGEYPGFDKLNKVGEMLKEVDGKTLKNVMQVIGDVEEAIKAIQDGDVIFYDDIENEYSLGETILNATYNGDVPEDILNEYFDYDRLGRDISFGGQYTAEDDNGDEVEVSAGEYWCGDEDATDKEIGQAYVDYVGINDVPNKNSYVDYRAYGEYLTRNKFKLTRDGAVEDLR